MRARWAVAGSLFVALAGSAFAQRSPQPPSLDELASQVRQAPSDRLSVNPRYGMLLVALQRLRRKPGPALERRILTIRALLGAGRLTPAARMLDRLIVDAAAQAHHLPPLETASPDARVPTPPGGFSTSEPEVLGDTPRLLSTAGPASIPAEPRPSGFAGSVASVASAAAGQTPAPSGAPWPFFMLAAVVVGGVGAALAVQRRRAPAPGPKTAGRLARLRDKYEVGKVVARGGMGEVYEGKDLRLGRRVAIKRMLAEAGADVELRRLFLREAMTVAKLSHPYIVPIHECVEDNGELYLVFEYVDGEPLSRRLSREARLPLKECRRVLTYVCQAIDHAHKQHVLHRDLKPANIMLDASGIARVMDFGIALESTRTLTSRGAAPLDVSGTLRYMPPEQHFGRSVRASDIYALGVCLYEMATGHTPFTASTVEELIEQKRARRFPPASTLVPGLGKDFDVLIAAALQPDPGSRVSSAAEFLESLEGLPAQA